MNVTSSQISFKARVRLDAYKAASKFLERDTQLAVCQFQEPSVNRMPKVFVKMFNLARFIAAPLFKRNEVKTPS